MIKVEHTKTHRSHWYNHNPIDVLVAEAELVLVECEILRLGDIIINYSMTQQKPILISRTKKIEEGDWYLANNTIFKADNVFYQDGRNNPNRPNQFKILALPEHFSPQQLQMIVDGELKEGNVLIECDKYNPFSFGDESTNIYSIKLNPHITIYPVEEKMYTVNQIITYLAGRFQNNPPMEYILSELSKGDLTKWFEKM